MNHKRYLHKLHQSDLSFRSKPEVKVVKNSYLMNDRRYFYNLLIILKIYNYITFHTQTWPLLTSSSGRNRRLRERIFGSTVSHVFCTAHFARKRPFRTHRLCTHTARGSSLQSGRTPNWITCAHVPVYSLLSSRTRHHGCEFCRETCLKRNPYLQRYLACT